MCKNTIATLERLEKFLNNEHTMSFIIQQHWKMVLNASIVIYCNILPYNKAKATQEEAQN